MKDDLVPYEVDLTTEVLQEFGDRAQVASYLAGGCWVPRRGSLGCCQPGEDSEEAALPQSFFPRGEYMR